MIELNYEIQNVQANLHAATPGLTFQMRVTSLDSELEIHNVLLQCQLQIESMKRRYSPEQQQKLTDLFGEPDRWSQTLRTMFWTHANVTAPPFQGETLIDLHVPCTFDFNTAATKYFHALDDEGEIPLLFLFSGSVFYAGEQGGLRVAPIDWGKEAKFSLPAATWKQMMDHYYPGTAWLCLPRNVVERLRDFRAASGAASWEQAIEALLDERESELTHTTLEVNKTNVP